jgi:hypothetical protein
VIWLPSEHHSAKHRFPLYRTASHCILLRWLLLLHCIAILLRRTTVHHDVPLMHVTAFHCVALRSISHHYCFVLLRCVAPQCVAMQLHCAALHCAALQRIAIQKSSESNPCTDNLLTCPIWLLAIILTAFFAILSRTRRNLNAVFEAIFGAIYCRYGWARSSRSSKISDAHNHRCGSRSRLYELGEAPRLGHRGAGQDDYSEEDKTSRHIDRAAVGAATEGVTVALG